MRDSIIAAVVLVAIVAGFAVGLQVSIRLALSCSEPGQVSDTATHTRQLFKS